MVEEMIQRNGIFVPSDVANELDIEGYSPLEATAQQDENYMDQDHEEASVNETSRIIKVLTGLGLVLAGATGCQTPLEGVVDSPDGLDYVAPGIPILPENGCEGGNCDVPEAVPDVGRAEVRDEVKVFTAQDMDRAVANLPRLEKLKLDSLNHAYSEDGRYLTIQNLWGDGFFLGVGSKGDNNSQTHMFGSAIDIGSLTLMANASETEGSNKFDFKANWNFDGFELGSILIGRDSAFHEAYVKAVAKFEMGDVSGKLKSYFNTEGNIGGGFFVNYRGILRVGGNTTDEVTNYLVNFRAPEGFQINGKDIRPIVEYRVIQIGDVTNSTLDFATHGNYKKFFNDENTEGRSELGMSMNTKFPASFSHGLRYTLPIHAGAVGDYFLVRWSEKEVKGVVTSTTWESAVKPGSIYELITGNELHPLLSNLHVRTNYQGDLIGDILSGDLKEPGWGVGTGMKLGESAKFGARVEEINGVYKVSLKFNVDF